MFLASFIENTLLLLGRYHQLIRFTLLKQKGGATC